MRNLYFTIENQVRRFMYGNNLALRKLYKQLMKKKPAGHLLDGCILYEGECAEQRYAAVFCELNRQLPEEDCMLLLGNQTSSFLPPDTPPLSGEEVEAVFAAVNQVLPYTERVIESEDLEIMLFADRHTERNGETTAVFPESGMHGYVCLYSPHLDCVGMSGAAVLLHELGHLLHMKMTGTLDEIPASFLAFLQAVGVKHRSLDKVQILDLFADTFLIAVQTRTVAFPDPFPMIDPNFKQVCFDYIVQGIEHLGSDTQKK